MDSVKEQLISALQAILATQGVVSPRIILEHPENFSHGDYTTNVALVYSKDLKEKPFIIAQKIVTALQEKNIPHVEKIDIAGPGFINITLDRTFFSEASKEILKNGSSFGTGDLYHKQKVIVEYTDPNPFKEFHIGHLMSNAIGEAISRLVEAQGAKLKRACYQGDVGVHVAKAVWGLLQMEQTSKKPSVMLSDKKVSLVEKAELLGEAYVKGSESYELPNFKAEIDDINKKIYEGKDKEISKLYKLGREVSLTYFETIYKKLGTKFDYYFFESESGAFGKEIVEKNTGTVFEKSEGAVIFDGEKHGLHKRVFISSLGLPTYEAKELGLAQIKYKKFAYDRSVVITGNEVNDYFRVLLKAMSLIFPELAAKTDHISHGMLRFAEGKMSSRKGNVITAESLINEASRMIEEKMKDRDFSEAERSKVIEQVAIGAIKYSILKQSPGTDIIFDMEKSLSFEGDSGPYLQYTTVRAGSLLEKGKGAGIKVKVGVVPPEIAPLERMLYRFPEIVLRSCTEYAPHHLTIYLTEVASLFNSWYATTKIVEPSDPYSPYRLALVEATRTVLSNGLNLLGISVPERM